ncbi:hypothetical protein AB6M97_04415 [Streptococcus hillyeri]|uniref:Uncharacterized protein n=1 Tax=Streptococcus hillyeri TaxID=2282420 RepID=A0A3L9DVI8_9STRE|nr:hypothetical protein [Streptococcus hillyeri]RLY05261.1 hypothetical protein EAF07_00745 [Streptococcus hillyeri]
MKRFICALFIAVFSFASVIYLFSESVWSGPILLTISFFAIIYSLVGLSKRSKVFKEVISFFVELLLSWP